jgi:EAL domain-containing protein (putative c-di-GMP-specific phosphodiesterase class I)
VHTLDESIHRPGWQQASGTVLAEIHEYESVENLLGFLEKYRSVEVRIYLDEVGIELLPAFAVLSVEPVAQLAGWFQLSAAG